MDLITPSERNTIMRTTHRILGAAAAIAIVATLGACGDDSSAPTSAPSSDTPPTTAASAGPAETADSADGADTAAANVELSADFCAKVSQENPPADLAAAAPEQLRDGTAAVVAFAETLSSQEANPDVGTELADTLGAPGVAEQIRALASAVAEQCGDGEAAQILPEIATAADFAAGEADPAYCAALRTEFADPSKQPAASKLADLAPAEQRAALQRLAASPEGGGAAAANLGVLLGIGLYAEARCDVPGAFGMMFLAVAFAGEVSGN